MVDTRKSERKKVTPTIALHGAELLSSVTVDSYSVETKDEEGEFVGDRASKGAFRELLESSRALISETGIDPLPKAAEDLTKSEIDTILKEGDPRSAALVHTAMEEFAQGLASIIRRYLKLKAWQEVERIVVGGGFRDSRVGELAVSRTEIILHEAGARLQLMPIRHDPDEAGLIGAIHLMPSWMFKGHDAIIAVDIGGTNVRAGVVEVNQDKAEDLSKARVLKSELWRHADDKVTRDQMLTRLARMIEKLIEATPKKKALAPFIGIGCPGMIESDGTIDRGSQNLPGKWSGQSFNLPSALRAEIPFINKEETTILMHNDAVIQGLSEVPFMQDVKHWGILTIGTGLGNACFTNRKSNGDTGKGGNGKGGNGKGD